MTGESYQGKDLQPYKFGGKEEETMFRLNQYDFTARTLDEYGRFTTIDPLAEKYYSVSPYAYCGNNPILNVDPTGMDYWSTSNQEDISNFFSALASGETNFNFSNWSHVSDQTFLNKLEQGEITYNDSKNEYYFSTSEVIDGVLTVTGHSFPARLKPDFKSYTYEGTQVYEPVSGFWGHLAYYALGWGSTYSTSGFTYNVNTQGRITGFVPLTGTPPTTRWKGGKLIQKMGKAKGNMPGNNLKQNEQFRDIVNKLKLNEIQAEQLHRAVSKEGLGYQEILQVAKEMFK